jgi:hypothetical protein
VVAGVVHHKPRVWALSALPLPERPAMSAMNLVTRKVLKLLKYSCFRMRPAWVARMLDGFSLLVPAE